MRGTSTSLGVCQCCIMGISDIAVQPVGDGNSESTVRFLIEWVSDGKAEARTYLADHAEPDGASLIATDGSDIICYVVWESNYAGFRSHGVPLVHQIAVVGLFRRQGVATLLMDAAEQLVRDRGIATLGIPSACSTSMARLSGCTDGAAISPTAGAHAGASGRSAKACK
jgi:GNAT superfamily N-acetyltransferase